MTDQSQKAADEVSQVTREIMDLLAEIVDRKQTTSIELDVGMWMLAISRLRTMTTATQLVMSLSFIALQLLTQLTAETIRALESKGVPLPECGVAQLIADEIRLDLVVTDDEPDD